MMSGSSDHAGAGVPAAAAGALGPPRLLPRPRRLLQRGGGEPPARSARHILGRHAGDV